MHLLWINQIADFTGGCERYIADTVTLLKERGVSSSLLYSVDGWTEPRFVNAFDRGAFPLVDLERQIREIAPDVIYVHRLEGVEALADIRAAGIPAVRFIHDHKLFCPREHKYTVLGKQTCTRTVGLNCYTCLGVLNKVPVSQGLIRLKRPGVVRAEQQENVQTFQNFVVGSRYMADHLIAHNFPPERVHVLPLYTFPPQESPETTLIQREDDLLLFVGQLTTGKSVDTLLHAVAQTNRSCRLLIHGGGKFEAEYRALTKRLNLNNRVIFGGKVSGAELSNAYRRATAVIFPSRTPETFGLVGLEAMSLGTPVIATRVGGTTEWLEEGVTGLTVPPNDATALAQTIDRLLGDTNLQDRLKTEGLRRYHERFLPQHHIDGLVALLEPFVDHPVARLMPRYATSTLQEEEKIAA